MWNKQPKNDIYGSKTDWWVIDYFAVKNILLEGMGWVGSICVKKNGYDYFIVITKRKKWKRGNSEMAETIQRQRENGLRHNK